MLALRTILLPSSTGIKSHIEIVTAVYLSSACYFDPLASRTIRRMQMNSQFNTFQPLSCALGRKDLYGRRTGRNMMVLLGVTRMGKGAAAIGGQGLPKRFPEGGECRTEQTVLTGAHVRLDGSGTNQR